MSEVNLRPDQEELINKAAFENGFKDFELIVDVGSIKGDNYLGIIHTVTVKDDEKELNLILKSAHTNENFRKEAPIHEAFKREAFLYSTYIPRLLKLQEEHSISRPFTGAAKFFGSSLEDQKESILMQNLKTEGFVLWDRMKPMDDEHIIQVFSEYARFHAASLALKHHYPEEFQELTKDIHLSVFESADPVENEARFSQYVSLYFQNGLSAVEGHPKAKAALEKMRGNIAQLFAESLAEGKDKFAVVHGDCWCNNILFKYEESLPKVCFIDWQISKVGPPALDLAYFFGVCGSKESFPHLPRFLETYHKELSRNLEDFGCDPEEVFSFEALKAQWKRNAFFGVFMGTIVIKLMLSNADEVPDFSESILDSFADFSLSKTSEYEKRMCDLVEFMADNDYI